MFKNIRQKEMEELTQNSSITIIDVRSQEEFASGALPKAINIDVTSSEFNKKIALLNPDQTYIVYCRSGMRSANACFAMMGLGFNHLYNLEGGLMSMH